MKKQAQGVKEEGQVTVQRLPCLEGGALQEHIGEETGKSIFPGLQSTVMVIPSAERLHCNKWRNLIVLWGKMYFKAGHLNQDSYFVRTTMKVMHSGRPASQMSLKAAASTINLAVIYHSVHSQFKFAQKLQNWNELRDFRKHATIIRNHSCFPQLIIEVMPS